MTAGLWLLLLVLVVAELVAVGLRGRALTRRRWAAEELEPTPLELYGSTLARLGMPVVVTDRLPEGMAAHTVIAREPLHIEASTCQPLLRAYEIARGSGVTP